MKIGSFSGKYAFLSNFHIEPDGTHVEGEFQAAKCVEKADRLNILRQADPRDAKRLGSGKRLNKWPDWDERRVVVMLELVTKKFSDHPTLAQYLIDTKGQYLEEGGWWHKHSKEIPFWGVDESGRGHNMLGHILMEVRGKL